jgi:FtsH-binding integral membrane protein
MPEPDQIASFITKGKFENDKTNPFSIALYIFIATIVMIAIFANSFSFEPVFRFQCKNYVLNTYLYFLLTWSLSLMIVHILDTLYTSKGQTFLSTPIFQNWTLIMIMFVVVFVLMMWTRNLFYVQHLVYIVWIFLVGCILYMIFSKNRGLFYQVVGTAFIILIMLTFISVKNPGLISPSMFMYMIAALVVLIIARIVELFLYTFNVIDLEKTRTSSRAMSYIAIILFSLFIIYDTDAIQKDARLCNISTVPPNYINSSSGIFLDTLNMVMNLFNIQD